MVAAVPAAGSMASVLSAWLSQKMVEAGGIELFDSLRLKPSIAEVLNIPNLLLHSLLHLNASPRVRRCHAESAW